MGEFGTEVVDVAQRLGRPPNDLSIVDLPLDPRFWDAVAAAKVLLFRPSRYRFPANAPGTTQDLLLPAGVDLYFMPGATLEVPAGVTLHIHGRVQAEDVPIFCRIVNYGYLGGSGATFVNTEPMAGEVRLLSPSQRQVRLSWWGAERMTAPNEQGANQGYLDATRALTQALRCASVDRLQRFDPVTGARLTKPIALPPLEVIVSGGEYHVHGPVTVRLDPDGLLKRARLIVRGESGPLSAPPVSFRRGLLPGESDDLHAPITTAPAPHLLQVGPGIDVDFAGLSFVTIGFIAGLLHVELRGTEDAPQRVKLDRCTFVGGHESGVALVETPGNESAVVSLSRLTLISMADGATRSSRASLLVEGSSRVMVHLDASHAFDRDYLGLFRDECGLRLRGGAVMVEGCFIHRGVGPQPMPLRSAIDERTITGRVTGDTGLVVEGNVNLNAPLTYAEGQDLFLEAPKPGGEWTQLTVMYCDSESWSFLASANVRVARAIARPTVIAGVEANAVNHADWEANPVPQTTARFNAELRRRNRVMMDEVPTNDMRVQLIPLSVVWAGNPGPLVMTGSKLYAATAIGPDTRVVDAGISYTPIVDFFRYQPLSTVEQRRSISQPWVNGPVRTFNFAVLAPTPETR